MINVENREVRREKRKTFLFFWRRRKKTFLRWNKSLKVIRFLRFGSFYVIYCFINTFERNSIEAFKFSSTDPKSFFARCSIFTRFFNTNPQINLKDDGHIQPNFYLFSASFLFFFFFFGEFSCEPAREIELHNLCMCLANGHFQFQLEACTELNGNV